MQRDFVGKGPNPRETYSLVIDGPYGSESLYTFNALDGIEVCPVTTASETTYCRDGYVHVELLVRGKGAAW
ncbi:MAG: hypothetical protein WA952_03140 [Lewinella sp.]